MLQGKKNYTVNTKPKAMAKPRKKLAKVDMTKEDEREAVSDSPKKKAKAKPMARANKTMDEEYDDLMADVEKNKPKAMSKAKPKTVIKTILKDKNVTSGKQIMPSRIGIQKLREELETAKNRGELGVQDTSAYMKMYDEWRDAKGALKGAVKAANLEGLREMYKRVLYTK